MDSQSYNNIFFTCCLDLYSHSVACWEKRRQERKTSSEEPSVVPAVVCQVSAGEGHERGGKSAASLASQVSWVSLAPFLRVKE